MFRLENELPGKRRLRPRGSCEISICPICSFMVTVVPLGPILVLHVHIIMLIGTKR